VRGLSRRGTQQDDSKVVLDGVDLSVRAGEIVGLAGLVGSGRTEVARAIFGADPFDSGEVYLEGERIFVKSPAQAIGKGIALVPEDRKLQALVLALAIRENIALPNLGRLSRFGFVRRREERELADRYIQALSIRTPSTEQKVINLSGGNQQKVVLAKWLALNPKVLIVDEPTRGIDIGAKAEVHSLLSKLASQGVAILMISSELPEILGMSDRIYVMREGKITGVIDRKDATEERVMELATGVSAESRAA
jgi:ABC-type sugar transport system ATPase subunit